MASLVKMERNMCESEYYKIVSLKDLMFVKKSATFLETLRLYRQEVF